jgi:hypothetical protein
MVKKLYVAVLYFFFVEKHLIYLRSPNGSYPFIMCSEFRIKGVSCVDSNFVFAFWSV